MSMTAYQTLLLDFTPRPIRTVREYRRALAFVEQHMQPHPPKAEAELLEREVPLAIPVGVGNNMALPFFHCARSLSLPWIARGHGGSPRSSLQLSSRGLAPCVREQS